MERFVAYDAKVVEIGEAETLKEAKKFPGVASIEHYDNWGRWVKWWELKNGRWILKRE